MDGRKHNRLPLSVRVAYRSTGTFLVAYSVNLSKGGVFLETEEPLPIGSPIQLELEVPTVGLLTVVGKVAWLREKNADGLPQGMGVQFNSLDDNYGHAIDELVKNFVGLTVLVFASSPDRLQLIGRYVRSIVACEIVEATSVDLAEVALDEQPDLLVVDLDQHTEAGLQTIRAAKQRQARDQHPLPVILMAQHQRVRTQGKEAGADEALQTPPSYADLQGAIIRALVRPASVQPSQRPERDDEDTQKT